MNIKALLFSTFVLAPLLVADASQAFPDVGVEYGFCTNCHARDPLVVVSATFQGCSGLSALYQVNITRSGAPASMAGWAVFLGSANIRNGYGSTGSFAVESGSYTLYGRGYTGSNSVDFNAPLCTSCTDLDNDGFAIDGGSCGQLDCNDADATIHPGAAEVKHDGIDQDCNGYDLSINILTATWSKSKKRLTVVSTSDYGVNALLSVNGFGGMLWSAKTGQWTLTSSTSSMPATVTVLGPEGSQSATVTQVK